VRREHNLDRQREERPQPLGNLLARHSPSQPLAGDLEATTEIGEGVAGDHGVATLDPEHEVVVLPPRKRIDSEREPVARQVEVGLATAPSEEPGEVRTAVASLLGSDTTIRERWLAWDEGRSSTYEGVGIPLLASARNEWGVQPEGDQALLTSRAEVVLKGGPLGRLLEPLVAYQLKRVGPRTLAALKYLVDHGEPPKVRHAKLPRVATAC